VPDLQRDQSGKPDDEQSRRDNPEFQTLVERGVDPGRIRAVNQVGPWARLLFFGAGALANFVLAYALFVTIGLIGVPANQGVVFEVRRIENSGSSGLTVGNLLGDQDGQPFEADEVAEESFLDAGSGLLVLGSDERGVTEDLTAEQLASFVPGVTVIDVEEGSPAGLAGIRAADIIIGLDGVRSKTSDLLQRVQEASTQAEGRPVQLEIARDAYTLFVSVVPRTEIGPNQGRLGLLLRDDTLWSPEITLGIASVRPGYQQLSFTEALTYGVDRIVTTVGLIVSIPQQLINGTISGEEARPVSVVGISQVGGAFLQESVRERQPVIFLDFIALVSIFLGITNLLPIPALDGGRMLFVVIEILRGRPVSPLREGMIHYIGFALVLSLGLALMVFDLFNPIQLP
jgi:regulator of sigma E protease